MSNIRTDLNNLKLKYIDLLAEDARVFNEKYDVSLTKFDVDIKKIQRTSTKIENKGEVLDEMSIFLIDIEAGIKT